MGRLFCEKYSYGTGRPGVPNMRTNCYTCTTAPARLCIHCNMARFNHVWEHDYFKIRRHLVNYYHD